LGCELELLQKAEQQPTLRRMILSQRQEKEAEAQCTVQKENPVDSMQRAWGGQLTKQQLRLQQSILKDRCPLHQNRRHCSSLLARNHSHPHWHHWHFRWHRCC